jgi:hypothetical protein
MAFYTILAIVHLLQGFLHMLDGTRSDLNQQTPLVQIAAQAARHDRRGQLPSAAWLRHRSLWRVGSSVASTKPDERPRGLVSHGPNAGLCSTCKGAHIRGGAAREKHSSKREYILNFCNLPKLCNVRFGRGQL